jgi:ribosomal protein L4
MNIYFISLTIHFILLSTNIFKSCKSISSELVFHLQEHFKSDLILIVSDSKYTFNMVKKFHNQTHAFIQVIDINSENFTKNFRNLYHDIMVVADNKINLLEILPKVSKL